MKRYTLDIETDAIKATVIHCIVAEDIDTGEILVWHKDTLELLSKLKDYKYVDEMSDLKYGAYIRWIPIEDPDEIVLTKGGLFCEMKITDNGVFCICKNYGFNTRHFQIAMDKTLIFQKLTTQEMILLNALDHLSS